MIDLHLFALNCNESFRIVVDEKEKRAKLCCLTLSILVFYVKCFIINLLGPPDAYSNRAELHPELRMQRYSFIFNLQINRWKNIYEYLLLVLYLACYQCYIFLLQNTV